MLSTQKQNPIPSDNLKTLRYVSTGLFGAYLGMAIGKVIVPIIGIKNPQLALALTGLAAASLSYVGLSGSKVRGAATTAIDHYVTKSVVALAFAAAASYLGNISDQNHTKYQAERKARIFVEPQTVVGRKPVTIADQQCLYKPGQEVTFEHNGKTSYTMCPR